MTSVPIVAIPLDVSVKVLVLKLRLFAGTPEGVLKAKESLIAKLSAWVSSLPTSSTRLWFWEYVSISVSGVYEVVLIFLHWIPYRRRDPSGDHSPREGHQDTEL